MEDIKEVKTEGFSLPKEKVVVKFIPRKIGMAANVGSDHVISGGMLSGVTKKFVAPLDRSGAIQNILTKEEKSYLEEKLNVNLSVYNSDFWKTFTVKLKKDDASNQFDLSNPFDYISIKILERWKDTIAPSWKDRNLKQTYQFVITRDAQLFDEKKAKLDTKKEAFKLYGKIEDDKDKLLGVLKLLSNKNISEDSKLDWLQGQIEEYVDTMPSLFLEVIKDPYFDVKVLINKGIDNGAIIRSNNRYSTIDGLDLAEGNNLPTYDNAVSYLDDAKNQEVRSLIEARINRD